MATTIVMPHTLQLLQSLNFCKDLDKTEGNEPAYVFDHKNLRTVEPFGMLLIASKIRHFVMQNSNSEYSDANFKHCTYAEHMGFFRSLYVDFRKTGNVMGNSSYVPITCLDVIDLQSQAVEWDEHIGETLERKAMSLSQILAQGNRNLSKTLTFAIRELMRNIVEHSRSHEIWFAGQYWPTKDAVEVAILDEGTGIRKGLSGNPYLSMQSDDDALYFAVEPGISGTMYRGKSTLHDDVWANSGFGLYMTSSLCQQGGSFTLASGSKALYLSQKKHAVFNTSFAGTAIRMRLRVSALGQLDAVNAQLLRDGERQARKNSKLKAMVTASKVSRLLVSDDE